MSDAARLLQVQFLAVEEQEYSANYRLLQAAGMAREMAGLNARAKVGPKSFVTSSQAVDCNL